MSTHINKQPNKKPRGQNIISAAPLLRKKQKLAAKSLRTNRALRFAPPRPSGVLGAVGVQGAGGVAPTLLSRLALFLSDVSLCHCNVFFVLPSMEGDSDSNKSHSHRHTPCQYNMVARTIIGPLLVLILISFGLCRSHQFLLCGCEEALIDRWK